MQPVLDEPVDALTGLLRLRQIGIHERRLVELQVTDAAYRVIVINIDALTVAELTHVVAVPVAWVKYHLSRIAGQGIPAHGIGSRVAG